MLMACSMDSARGGLVRRRAGRGDKPFVDVRMRVLKELRRQPLGGASSSSSEKKKLMSSRGTTLLLSSTKAVMMETSLLSLMKLMYVAECHVRTLKYLRTSVLKLM